jgi:hypothetical protein
LAPRGDAQVNQEDADWKQSGQAHLFFDYESTNEEHEQEEKRDQREAKLAEVSPQIACGSHAWDAPQARCFTPSDHHRETEKVDSVISPDDEGWQGANDAASKGIPQGHLAGMTLSNEQQTNANRTEEECERHLGKHSHIDD